MEKKLKMALCLLIIVLITLIAFAGVYSSKTGYLGNIIPKYSYDTSLNGKRVSYFKLSDDTTEKIYDKDGKEVSSIPEGANEADYKKETVKVNLEEDLTKENYAEVKSIFEGRLKEIGVKDYVVRLNRDTGDIVVELQDNVSTDTFLQYLTLKGDFSITDSESGDVLLNKSDVEKASVVYGNTSAGEITVYLTIKFNKEGTKKLEEVSTEYQKVEESSESGDNKQKQVTLTINGTDLLTTYFGEVISNGELSLTTGSGKDSSTVYNYAKQSGIYAMLINNGEMPLTYEIENTEYLPSSTSENDILLFSIIIGVFALVASIYMIARYKADGLICGVSLVLMLSLLSILLRYTLTTLSLNALAIILSLIVFQVYFMISILESIKKNPGIDNVISTTFKTYAKKLDMITVLLVLSVVFTFMPEVKVYSIGMVLFYGIISAAIANLVFMRTMLINKYR